jgi:hypothetical protein
MEQEATSSVVARIARSVAIVTVAIFVVIGLIYWVADWTTAYQYGTGLIIGGLVTMVFGLFSVAGGMGMTRSFEYQQAQSASYDTGVDRTKESRQNLAETYAALIILGLAGFVAIVAGLLIRLIAG